MAVKWSTPGIGFSEIDQTVRPNADPGDGIGAIVINANRGYPNQRVLCTTIDKFHEFFGTPDDPNQFGHFAAQVYFEQGGATQLLAVRATQGDEGYAQIQFPYTDSTDKNHEQNVQILSYVDNELENQIKMINAINTVEPTDENYYNPLVASANGFKEYTANGKTFDFYGSSKQLLVDDIYENFYGNSIKNEYVYRDMGEDNGVVDGRAFVLENIKGSTFAPPKMFAMAEDTYSSTVYDRSEMESVSKNDIYYNQYLNQPVYADNVSYYPTRIHVPSVYSFDGKDNDLLIYTSAKFEGDSSFDQLLDQGDMLTSLKDLDGEPTTIDAGTEVCKADIVDWDDMLTKTFTVTKEDWDKRKDVIGIKFTEYGTADSRYLLVLADPEPRVTKCSEADNAELNEIASDYAVDVSDIANDKYAILTYVLSRDEQEEKQKMLIVVNKELYSEKTDEETGVKNLNSAAITYKNTWALYLDYATKKFTVASNYGVGAPKEAIKPWQVSFDGDEEVNPLYAISSTEVFSDPTGIWKDGYTASCKYDGEPGNGDIEMYRSGKSNQLIIGAIGPGKFGNDVGISIITPEAALVPALYGQNAFSWLYKYDDEDKVNDSGLDYRSNPNNLTWKKVYKINVYVKAPSKTQSVWGFGLDALMSSPVESWLVSNDPNAKDENGNSLWAPYVINGNSQFIYVSKKSVEAAVDYKGNYAMPDMTWSIYQMTGGSNSKLNNVKEKTKCLDLYKNRKKAYFDYLFNVEPIESFSGKQKYIAMQNRIGQIASSRKMDLGIIQCTSKEAKTIRLKLSEGKMFSFADGSYVAGYDDYDSYFDPFTSTWVMLPRSVAGAVACCYIDNYDKPWMAPAGVANGRIAYSDHPMVRLDDDEFGQLYNIHVNSTMNYPGYGEVLMGQKTMLKKESALNRIDVRKLCNYIEKRLENKLLPYLYQKNTTTNRSSMRTAVDSFLGRIQAGQGIISRKVEVVPDQKDTHLVYVNITFVPAESIERIEVTLILNRETGSITPVESTSRI